MNLLRFSTAGSVDDGKSTLIGRLLYDAKSIFEDQYNSLVRTTARRGGVGGNVDEVMDDGVAVDLALLTDGLVAEREQGITIDVAYRYFSTRQAEVYYRRHARSRAVHPQHGDRCERRLTSWRSSSSTRGMV